MHAESERPPLATGTVMKTTDLLIQTDQSLHIIAHQEIQENLASLMRDDEHTRARR